MTSHNGQSLSNKAADTMTILLQNTKESFCIFDRNTFGL